jgi:hypothetical protein
MSDSKTLDLQIALSSDDYIRFQSAVQKRIAREAPVRYAVNAVLETLPLFVTFFAVPYFIIASIDAFKPFAMVLAIAVVCAAYAMKKTLASAFRPSQQSEFFRPRQLKVSTDGIEQATSNVSERFSWNAFRAVEEGKDAIYLFLDRVRAIVVPYRVFHSDADRDAFLASCKTQVKA